ncbi:MAG: helix-turn-helix domain-containing protein, partial [Polyangiaceae bacterium]
MLGRPPSFDRDDVLRRATMVFWKHGYDATSIALLTKSMGIGAPSLYAAFGDKRALFEEALGYYSKTYGAFIMQVAREEADARTAVERLLGE